MTEKEPILPCGCNANFSIGQYQYPHPYAWDGYSEKICNKCGKRYGRWSKRELVGEDYELRDEYLKVKK